MFYWIISFLIFWIVALISKIEFDDDISALIPASEEAKISLDLLQSIAFTANIIVNIRILSLFIAVQEVSCKIQQRIL